MATSKPPPLRTSNALLICYVCQEIVKKCCIAEHLYFGPLQCRECGLTMEHCNTFAGKMKSMGNYGGDFPCLHLSLKWSKDPVDYLMRRLRRDLVKKEFKCQPTSKVVVERVSAYVEKLSFLEHRSPWRTPFQELKAFIKTKTSTENLMEIEKTAGVAQREASRLEHQPAKEKRSLHKRHNSHSRHKHRSKHHHRTHTPKDRSTQMPESMWHRDTVKNDVIPSVAQGCLPAELGHFGNERIPQTVEEEAIIPHMEWERDVLSVEGVEEAMEEVVMMLSSDGDGQTPFVLEANCVIGSGVPEVTLLTVGDLEVTAGATEEECEMEYIPENAEVGAKPDVAGGEDVVGDVGDDEIQMDTSSTRLEEKRIDPVDGREGADERHMEEKERELKPGTDEEIKNYNHRRHQHEPPTSVVQKVDQKKEELGEDPLPVAKRTFREHTTKEEEKGPHSLHLVLNLEEAESVVDANHLLSQIYELDQLEEEREHLSVGGHNASEGIVSQVRDGTKNSLCWKGPRLLPSPDHLNSTSKSLSRSTSKPLSRSTSKSLSRSTSKPLSRSTSKPLSRSTSKSLSRSTSKSLSRSTSKSLSRSSSKSLSRSSSKSLSRSQTWKETPKKRKEADSTKVEDHMRTTSSSSSKSKLDPMVFGKHTKDPVQTPEVHVVYPPDDGFYYTVMHPSMTLPKECPMCYFRVFPCMFSVNLVTGLATGRCCGCPLTIYVVHEPTDASQPRVVFETGRKRGAVVPDQVYRPKPGHHKGV
ncbi:uncharacterized protein [Panulirus ornatus]|uniref:uncharacterized protein n=1 Tax=Panulirus ornatus TaxID=150431 RepID=UPI003A89D543